MWLTNQRFGTFIPSWKYCQMLLEMKSRDMPRWHGKLGSVELYVAESFLM